jgi:hypothetical protein
MNSPLNAATNAVSAAPIYAFATGVTDDGPQFVAGQFNIIDVVPGDEGYSDLWEVNLVMVDEDYEANSITSKAALEAGDFEVVNPGLFVNCPVVGVDSTLEDGEELTRAAGTAASRCSTPTSAVTTRWRSRSGRSSTASTTTARPISSRARATSSTPCRAKRATPPSGASTS